MEEIKHWWNCTEHLKSLDGESINNCRMYFIQRCRQRSKGLELPKQNFGPSVMCSHCGSLWSKHEPQVRIISGQSPTKSIKKIIKSCSEDVKLPRYRATLMKKSLKSKNNKIVFRCSVCSKNTEVDCNKPPRLRPSKKVMNESDSIDIQKKKKKKGRDKTAGLNLSSIQSPHITKEIKQTNQVHVTPVVIKVKNSNKSKDKTPIQKVRKINLNKLNNVLNGSKVQKSKSNLSSFLKELY